MDGKLIEDLRLRNRTFVFKDRDHAGTLLAEKLMEYKGKDVITFAIPAGGVPVAVAISKCLQAPFDVLVVRKIHIPWNMEAGFGAVSWDGTILLNKPLLALLGLTEDEIESCIAFEKDEIEKRMRLFRGQKPFPDIEGRSVILVDDGIIPEEIPCSNTKDPLYSLHLISHFFPKSQLYRFLVSILRI